MYIPRIVIDANVINARGDLGLPGMAEMAALEQLNSAGGIEIVRTSTLAIDLWGYEHGRRKAEQYLRVGASFHGYMTSEHVADTTAGDVLRPSRFFEFAPAVFPGLLERFQPTSRTDVASVRDVLHLDQCWSNAVDIFITQDLQLRQAQPALDALGFDTPIRDPAGALALVRAKLVDACGSSDPSEVAEYVQRLLPILAGPRECHEMHIRSAAGESLLSVQAVETVIGPKVVIAASVRDSAGVEATAIAPWGRPVFRAPGSPSVKGMMGPEGPILVGDQRYRSFVVSTESELFIAGRYLPSGHTVLSHLLCRDVNGRVLATANRDRLDVYGQDSLEFIVRTRGTRSA